MRYLHTLIDRVQSNFNMIPTLQVGVCLIVMTFLIALAGCFSDREHIVRGDLEPPPPEAKGAMYVATDKDIDVGIEGSPTVAKKNVCGYYLVHKNDLAAIMREYKAAPDKNALIETLKLKIKELDPKWTLPQDKLPLLENHTTPIQSSALEYRKMVASYSLSEDDRPKQ